MAQLLSPLQQNISSDTLLLSISLGNISAEQIPL